MVARVRSPALLTQPAPGDCQHSVDVSLYRSLRKAVITIGQGPGDTPFKLLHLICSTMIRGPGVAPKVGFATNGG